MAITRVPVTNDSGDKVSGTPFDAAYNTALHDNIDALVADSANVAFAAGNFTGSVSMTWTLTSPDQTTFRRQIINKKMTVWFSLVTTTVGGTPSTDLLITIPDSKSAAVQINGVFWYSVAGVENQGFLQVDASGTKIRLLKDQAGSGTWANSTNLTSVWGQVDIPIN